MNSWLSGEGLASRTGYVGKGGDGEVLDGGRERDVAEGGGVGLSVAGEPAEEGGESFPAGWLGWRAEIRTQL